MLREYIRFLLNQKLCILIESEDDEDDNWLDEWIGGWFDIPWEKAKEMLKKFGTDIEEVKTSMGKVLYVFEYFGEKYVIEGESESPSTVQDFLDNISRTGNVEEYVKLPDYSSDFWSGPSPLYHGTYEENIDDIMKNGLQARNESRGISNKGTGNAIFTTLEPEYAESHYGDKLIEIDTVAMKQDGYTPEVIPELPIIEYELMDSLAYLIGGENPQELEHGIDYDSMVVFGNIPAKYLNIK